MHDRLWFLAGASVFPALFFSASPAFAQLKVITPNSPVLVQHVRISPGLQKILEKPRWAALPGLRIEGYIDSRGAMTVGFPEEELQSGLCQNCVSGRVQEWKPEGQGVLHSVNPKGLKLSTVNPLSLVCKQDVQPGRLVCELR
jgi:hypothetical protein